jgi:K+-transporting ATPase ATPase A chain
MSSAAWGQLIVFLVLLLALAWPLARWIHAVMEGRVAPLQRLERPLLRLAGVDASAEQGWLRYALGLLLFNALGVIAVYALQRLQPLLPLNPQGFGAVSPDSAFNTAVSFVTNTNWQGYGGESTMSHLTQMLALTVQNFLSAATGLAVVMALLRGFARHNAQAIGNVWADLTRATLWVLLPLAFVFALVLAGLGVVQTLAASQPVRSRPFR